MTKLMLYRECKAIDVNGKESQVKVGVEQPKCLNGVWNCKVVLGVILQDQRHAYGADAWDAVQKAMVMVYLELRVQKLAGWKFLWFNDETDDLTVLLPDFGKSTMDF